MSFLSGTPAADTLNGTAGADTILALTGSDVLRGLAGADLLIGDGGMTGPDDDTLDGGAGADTMMGGRGNDTYIVDSLGDIIIDNAGFDTVQSTLVRDLRLAAMGGVDGLIYSGAAGVTLYGRESLASRIEARLGAAVTIMGGSGADTLIGGGGGDRIEGGDGHDSIEGGGGADRLFGGAGNDTLAGGAGADTLTGGGGNDTYLVGAGDRVSDTQGGIDTFVGTLTSLGVAGYATTIENLTYTGAVGAKLNGNNLTNRIIGGNGADSVIGLNGADTLAGGGGADVLEGGAGNDWLTGGGFDPLASGDARFLADTSADQLSGGEGDDTYVFLGGNDVFADGGTLAGNLDRIWALRSGATLAGTTGIEALVLAGAQAVMGTGSSGDDLIVGGELASNLIFGGAGNDRLVSILTQAVPQDDTMIGGVGNDLLLAVDLTTGPAAPAFSLLGGTGNDLYVASARQVAISDAGGTDTVLVGSAYDLDLRGASGVERILLSGIGAAVEITTAGTAFGQGWQALFSALPTQLLFAGRAGQTVIATDAANLLVGNDFDTTLDGAGGNDTIEGSGGVDTLRGGDGDDLIFAVSQAVGPVALTSPNGDWLFGGRGNDTLVAEEPASGNYGTVMQGDLAGGPQGNDIFRLRETGSLIANEISPGNFEFRGAASIQDFQQGRDRIELPATAVGNGNGAIDGVSVVNGPSDVISATDELILVRTDVGQLFFESDPEPLALDGSLITAVLVPAASSFAAGDTRLVVVDNGTHSAVFLFTSTAADNVIGIDELSLLVMVRGTDDLGLGDLGLI